MSTKPQSKLLQALAFVSSSGATECQFNEGFVFSEHKGIHLCHPVDEHLSLTVGIKPLQKAIKVMGEHVALTELADALQIKNDDLSMSLGHNQDAIAPTPIFDGDFGFIYGAPIVEALISLAKIPNISGEVIVTTIHSTGNTFVATNRRILLEVWHGLGFPQGNLPGNGIVTLGKIKTKCDKVSWTDKQVIFDFNGSLLSIPWIPGEWLNYERFFDLEPHWDGAELKAALIQVLPFCEEVVSFRNDEIVGRSAKAEVKHLVVEKVGTCDYFAKEMQYFVKHGEVFANNEEKFAFQGGKYRGVVSFVPKKG